MPRSQNHTPVMVVVGLSMVLIAALSAVALWYLSKRRRQPPELLGAPAPSPAGSGQEVAEA